VKKLVFVLGVASMLLSCVTRPYTNEDKHFITSKGSSWVLSLIPGLTQIVNGEYVEGAILAAGFIGFTTVSALMYNGAIDNPTISNDSDTRLSDSLLAWSIMTHGYSYFDGVASTYRMHGQKYELENPTVPSTPKIPQKSESAITGRERIFAEYEERRQALQIKLEGYRKIVTENINRAKAAGSPILIYDYRTDWPNSAGGVDCIIRFVNISDKRLKYVYFTVVPYNSVDDKAYSTVGHISEVILDHTGYDEKNDIVNFSRLPLISSKWPNVWYNRNIRYMEITKIEVIFDDNSKMVMNNNMINSSVFYSEEKLDSDIRYIFDNGQ